jgi:hypothetical protein
LKPFASRYSCRYNRFALQCRVPKLFAFFITFLFLILSVYGCSVALGPGYSIQKQNFELHFVLSPEPHLAVRCTYQLVNSGNQPLQSIRLVVPPAGAFHRAATVVEWNGQRLSEQLIGAAAQTDMGDTIELRWNDSWNPKQKRTLLLSYELSSGSHLGSFLAVTPETFFAYPDSWNPTLLTPKGTLGAGGGPPKEWNISIRVPNGFLVHASGASGKVSRSHDEVVYSFLQKPGDFAPFAAGGKYIEKEINSAGERILFWTLQPVDSQAVQSAAASVAQRARYYETEYGKGGKRDSTIRLLECVIPERNFGCGQLPQTIFIHQAWIARGLKDNKFYQDADFELAYTWFGGVSHVRFDEFPLPMDAAAPYAGWEAQAREEGGDAGSGRIRWLLKDFDEQAVECKDKIVLPRPASLQSCSYSASWSKSGLFFFALEDRIGRSPFHNALRNMIQARRGRDFELADLISAIEAESHQPQGQFVREWLKHRGIPDDFRARYSSNVTPTTSSSTHSTKEPQK